MEFNRNNLGMIKDITGKEFQESGMLWLVNNMLHNFGMAIVYNSDTDELKAALVKFRGFETEDNDEGYKKVTQYMIDNAKNLMKDIED